MRIREREERAMSFASQISDLSSAMSLDEEEAGTFISICLRCRADSDSSDVCYTGRFCSTSQVETDGVGAGNQSMSSGPGYMVYEYGIADLLLYR